MCVLRYINNDVTRYKTFVANRLSVIREGSNVNQWNYVSTKDNPADIASRGLNVDDPVQLDKWINGPDFLWRQSEGWPGFTLTHNMDHHEDNDPEVKKVAHAATVQEEASVIDKLVKRFSSWSKLKRITAWVLLFAQKARGLVIRRKKLREQMKSTGHTTTDIDNVVDIRMKESRVPGVSVNNLILPLGVIEDAEKSLYIHEQHQHFAEEIQVLLHIPEGHHGHLKKGSPLYKLNPIMVDGLVRVGGRLERAEMQFDAKHPIILPRNSPISSLILEETHRSVGHCGRSSMLAKLQQRYWIIGANQCIRKLLAVILCSIYSYWMLFEW